MYALVGAINVEIRQRMLRSTISAHCSTPISVSDSAFEKPVVAYADKWQRVRVPHHLYHTGLLYICAEFRSFWVSHCFFILDVNIDLWPLPLLFKFRPLLSPVTCPDGRSPLGACVNGNCPIGYICSANNLCCQGTQPLPTSMTSWYLNSMPVSAFSFSFHFACFQPSH